MKAEYIDHCGTDLSVVNAARVSFAKESEWELKEIGGLKNQPDVYGLCEKDERLIRYLAKHNHWSPFAHTAITLRMSAPVPIRTQCFKHKAGFVENEESRRYISDTPTVYVPTEWRSRPLGSVKQGSGDAHAESNEFSDDYVRICNEAVALYEHFIANGICPEQARFILPQGVLVNWIWTGNLASYARFYNQRTDPHAQKEVQDLARMVGDIIEPLFPVSWKALTT